MDSKLHFLKQYLKSHPDWLYYALGQYLPAGHQHPFRVLIGCHAKQLAIKIKLGDPFTLTQLCLLSDIIKVKRKVGLIPHKRIEKGTPLQVIIAP